MACSLNDVDETRLLLLIGAEPSSFCLSVPLEWGFTEIVQLILQDGRIDPSVDSNKLARTAAKLGFDDVLALLLQDERVVASNLEDYRKFGLKEAILGSHAKCVEMILKVTLEDDDLIDELITACGSSSIEVVKLLLNKIGSKVGSGDLEFLIKVVRARKRAHVEQLVLSHFSSTSM